MLGVELHGDTLSRSAMREVFNVLLQTNPRLLMVRRVLGKLAAHLG
jgi:hypothetical protein